jgi:hypothetical protein
VSGSE